jgi:hypothetical protein
LSAGSNLNYRISTRGPAFSACPFCSL